MAWKTWWLAGWGEALVVAGATTEGDGDTAGIDQASASVGVEGWSAEPVGVSAGGDVRGVEGG